MAKRKRLIPARAEYLDGADPGQPAPETKAMAFGAGAAPIARVAGEASASAALVEVTETLSRARSEGRMIELLPLDAIDDRHLVRDRLVQDDEEMTALTESIRTRGQQMPIEVVRLPDTVSGPSHGLISGWRRLTALRRLHQAEGNGKFATVRAMIVTPETAQDSYVAMVEENEIRVDLSHYERARIAVRAMQEGVYPTQRAALQGLFANATRSKRSKIGTFVRLVEAFDEVLRFPAAISEKLGLAAVREMTRSPEFTPTLKGRLTARPCSSAEAETRLLAETIAEFQNASTRSKPEKTQEKTPHKPGATPVVEGIEMRFVPGKGRIELSGDRVTETLAAALQDWLRNR